MQHLFKNYKSEQALETPTLAEVINSKSDYFGESFYLTNKANIDGENWYRCHPEYYVKGVDYLWFKEAEVSWFEEE